MDSEKLVDEYDVIDRKMSIILYDMYMNKFRKMVSDEEYAAIQEYNEKVILFVEQLREYDSSDILKVLLYLDKKEPTLIDITIMQWCLPRAQLYRSAQMYDKEYKKNIATYNHKLINIIDSYVFRNFVVDCITKTCSVPVHCIDILWKWIPIETSFDFTFCSATNGNYIGIVVDLEDEYVKVNFNMESILHFNVGNLMTNKGPFKYQIKTFIYNKEYQEVYEKSVTQKTYRRQAENIRKKYDENFIERI